MRRARTRPETQMGTEIAPGPHSRPPLAEGPVLPFPPGAVSNRFPEHEAPGLLPGSLARCTGRCSWPSLCSASRTRRSARQVHSVRRSEDLGRALVPSRSGTAPETASHRRRAVPDGPPRRKNLPWAKRSVSASGSALDTRSVAPPSTDSITGLPALPIPLPNSTPSLPETHPKMLPRLIRFADVQGSGLIGKFLRFPVACAAFVRFVFPFDKPKLPLESESRKPKTTKLSTGTQIPCGQHWITPSKGQIQRF